MVIGNVWADGVHLIELGHSLLMASGLGKQNPPVEHGMHVLRLQLDGPFVVCYSPVCLAQVVIPIAPLVKSFGKQRLLDQQVGELPDGVLRTSQAQVSQTQIEPSVGVGRLVRQDGQIGLRGIGVPPDGITTVAKDEQFPRGNKFTRGVFERGDRIFQSSPNLLAQPGASGPGSYPAGACGVLLQ